MIQVKNLHFTYRKTQKEAIQNMCFDVAEGEVFGFLGPSGAGKTTTQRLIIGVDISLWTKRIIKNYEIFNTSGHLYLVHSLKEQTILDSDRNEWIDEAQSNSSIHQFYGARQEKTAFAIHFDYLFLYYDLLTQNIG